MCVYVTLTIGLTCHPSRPFTMASCSRDSTVRLWSLTPLIAPLLINILTEHSWDDIIGNTGKSDNNQSVIKKYKRTEEQVIYKGNK